MEASYQLYVVGWLVVLRINVDLAIFQPYLDLEAGDNQSLKIQVARPGIEPRSSCSASQELNHSATAAPHQLYVKAEWRKVRKTNFEQRAITHEKVGQPWRKWILIYNSTYRSLLPTFIQICESITKKSPENECDGQTDWQTDRGTDRVQTYSPLRFHRWGTRWLYFY